MSIINPSAHARGINSVCVCVCVTKLYLLHTCEIKGVIRLLWHFQDMHCVIAENALFKRFGDIC